MQQHEDGTLQINTRWTKNNDANEVNPNEPTWAPPLLRTRLPDACSSATVAFDGNPAPLLWDLFITFAFRCFIFMRMRRCWALHCSQKSRRWLVRMRFNSLRSVAYWVACWSVWAITNGDGWRAFIWCCVRNGDISARCVTFLLLLLVACMKIYKVHPSTETLAAEYHRSASSRLGGDDVFLNHNFMHNVTDLDAAQPNCSPPES